MAKRNLTVRLEPELMDALETLARSMDRDRAWILNEAVRKYVDENRWQVEAIMRALSSADEGRLVESGLRPASTRLGAA